MPWKFRIYFENETVEESEEQFETEDEAERECLNYRERYSAHRDILTMENEPCDDSDIVDYELYEL